MNTIGVDYQQNVTVLCLAEGTGPASRVRSVGDGLRPIIPNAVSGNDWGSRALEAGGRESVAGEQVSAVGGQGSRAGGQGPPGQPSSPQNWGPGGQSGGRGPGIGGQGSGRQPSSPQDWGPGGRAEGPWLDEPDASLFWRGLYNRLYAYLGRIPPTSQRGYRLVAGLQAADWRAASDGVARLASDAGFGPPTCIDATDALLARHLSETRQPASGETTVTVVAAGDTATTVCSYRVRREGLASGRVASRILARDTMSRHLPYGHAHWAGRLLVHITDLFTEPIGSGSDLAMRDAALEFASRLRRVPSGRAVTWTGPHRDKLYAPLELTYADCAAWPEAAPYLSLLPDMIRDSVTALGGRSRPDLILVGGIGALWPFPVAAAAVVGQVLQSGSPEEDVARGAAWWPEVESLWAEFSPMNTGALSSTGSPLFATPLPDWLADVSAVVSETAAAESEWAEPDNPFLPREDLPSLVAAETAAFSVSEYASHSLRVEPAAEQAPFEPLGEIPESVSQMLKDSTPAPTHDFDLPDRDAEAKAAEDDDLEDLPPWDPRRNEI